MRNSGIVTHEPQAKAYLRAARSRFGLMLTLLWVLQGCMSSVQDHEWTRGEALCENNGGVKQVLLGQYYCKDGATYAR